jgi:hypothetical protein
MKLLKIDDNLGYYLDDQGAFSAIDKITTEDLLRLVDLTLADDEVVIDEYDDKAIKNQAHQILYKSIFEKLRGLRARKQEFTDESERLYLQDYEKYRDKPAQQETR